MIPSRGNKKTGSQFSQKVWDRAKAKAAAAGKGHDLGHAANLARKMTAAAKRKHASTKKPPRRK